MKKSKLTSIAVVSTLLTLTVAGSVQAAPKYNRFSGQDRFQTSIAIANQESQGQQTQNIVIASAYSFPDALAASTLATKLSAPIILVGTGMHDSQAGLDYIKAHLTAGGTVTIVGGVGVINKNIENSLLKAGYQVNRMGGADRFATDSIIVNNLNVKTGTPVIIANAYNFPDALGIASLAASKGWPILLSGPNQLPQAVQSFIKSDQPSDVYIVGGKGVLHDSIETDVQNADSTNSVKITRLGGQDRFETLSQILTKFYPAPTKIYLANGFNFADALTGSTLAAQDNAPILLINPKSGQLPVSIRDYLVTLRNANYKPEVDVLGGTASVPNWAIDRVNEILDSSSTTPAPVTAESTPVTGIAVTGADNAASVVNGSTLQMNAAITPSDATNQNITWSVTPGTGNAAISPTGLLTGSADGTVTVTATAADGSNVTGTLQVTVTAAPVTATVYSASTSDSTHIVLTMSSALTGSTGDPAAFTVSGAASNPTVSSVAVSGTTVTLTLSTPIVSSDTAVKVSYAKTGTNDLTTGTPAANFSDLAVTNNVQ